MLFWYCTRLVDRGYSMAATVWVDRYRIQRQLGKSDGYKTLLAFDLITQQPVVIKLLLYRGSFESKDLKLLQREAETLKALAHPSIPRYLDYFEMNLQDGRGFALVQTFIPGKSLQDYMDGGQRFTEAEVRHVAVAMLDILIYLHDRQPPLIHRDIKPSNILLTSEPKQAMGSVHLIDFSSVQNFALTTAGSFTVVGTYGYTPPEQSGGRPLTASDLYSLGATLISVLAGTAPSNLPRRGRRIEFESSIFCSPELMAWLRKMTEPALEKRFSSAQMALQALEQPQQSPDPKPKAPASSFATLHPKPGSPLPAPTGATKPANSKVVLTCQPNFLEVVIPSALGKTRLKIDQEKLVLVNEWMGLKVNEPTPELRQNLRSLEYSRSHLAIWAVTSKYELSNGNLSESEINWLVQELSHYLKLPVIQKRGV